MKQTIRTGVLLALLVPGLAVAQSGGIDSSFGGGLAVTPLSPNGHFFAAAVQPSDNKVVAVGIENYANNWNWVVVRYNTDGTLDSTFDADGKVSFFVNGPTDTAAYDVKIDTNGKIIVAGMCYNANTTDFCLARLNSNGSLDTSFDGDGWVKTAIATQGDKADVAKAVAIQSDGKIVAAGFAATKKTRAFAMVRYNTNGTLDTSFGTSGKMTDDYSTTQNDEVQNGCLAIQSDGKIVFGGYSGTLLTAGQEWIVARYNSNGSKDTGYGTSGKIVGTLAGSTNLQLRGLTIDTSSGKVLASGRARVGGSGFPYEFVLARYSTAGVLDTGFDVDGWTTTVTPIETNGHKVVVQADGKYLMSGSQLNTTMDITTFRFLSNGSLDTAYGTGGQGALADSGNYDNAYGLALDSNGNVILAGEATTSGVPSAAVVRYLP